MDKIKKALKKLSAKEKKKLKNILLKINSGKFQSLDLKKLKGRKDIFRVRQGDLRIIFQKTKDSVRILTLEKRGSKTYSKF